MSPGWFRLFLAALVVIAHTVGPFVGRPAVYLFFVLSGYWISRMWEKKYAFAKSPFFTFVVSRFWRLLPIYWICYPFTLAVAYATDRFTPAEWSNLTDPGWILRTLFLLGSGGEGEFRPLSSAWSLDYEMQFYLLAPWLVLFLPKLTPVSTRFAFGLCALGVLAFALHCIPYPDLVLQYLGFFGLGVVAHLGRWRPGAGLVKLSIIAGTIALIILCLGFVASTFGSYAWATSFTEWHHWRDALVAFLGVPVAIDSCYQPSSTLDRALGAASYPLYLVHVFVDIFFEQTLRGKSVVLKLGSLPIQWLLIAGFTAVLYRWIDRPIDRLRQAWVDSRSRKP